MGIEYIVFRVEKQHFDYVADFHNVLRTKYLCLRFRMSGIPVASIDKGRKGKRNWYAVMIKY